MAHDAQYLSPEAIYTLNRVLYEILDELELGPEQLARQNRKLWIVPTLFNKETRTFHSACVLENYWGPDRDQAAFRRFLFDAVRLLARLGTDKNLRKAFQQARSNLLVGAHYEDAVKKIDHLVEAISQHRAQCDTCRKNLASLKAIECLATKVGLLAMDGSLAEADCREMVRSLLLLYHGFKNHRHLHLSGILYRGCEKYDPGHAIVDRFEGAPVPGTWHLLGKFRDINGKDLCKEELFDQMRSALDGKVVINRYVRKDRGSSLWGNLAYLFVVKTLRKEQEKLRNRSLPVLVLPIYDTWLASRGYGGIWGCLICTFSNERTKQWFVRSKLRKVRAYNEYLSAELYMSALATIANVPITPPYDLVEHFVRTIIHLQDWERVTVCKKEADEAMPRRTYCYRRILGRKKENGKGDYRSDYAWERCEEKCDNNGDGCTVKGTGQILSWSAGKAAIWSKELIPELSDDEEQAFRDVVLEFEFPRAAFVPERCEADATHDLFKKMLIYEQIEVLRFLIPKVRARRAALRNAAVSIMGRNMSHNIGSHVLARLLLEEGAGASLGNSPTGQLMRYLQERMDFLAEASTTRPFFSPPTNLFGGVMSEFAGQPLICKYISGIGGFEATVKRWYETNGVSTAVAPDDIRFACTGGRSGMHAFYVIIENIIRNSAKHGSGNGKRSKSIEIRIRARDAVEEGWKDRYCEVLVWDLRPTNRISANRGGQGRECPREHINRILEKVPLVEQHGSINQTAWGIREMQVACTYLRGIHLEDLEARRPGEPPILQACLVNDDGAEGKKDSNNLAYRFYLEKALDLIVVHNNATAFIVPARTSGVASIAIDRLNQQTILKAEYCLWLAKKGPEEKVKLCCPVRLLKVSKAGDVHGLVNSEKLSVAVSLAEKWLDEICENKGLESSKICLLWTGRNGKCAVSVTCSQVEQMALGVKGDARLVFDDHGHVLRSEQYLVQHCDIWKSMNMEGRLKALQQLAFYEPFLSSYPQRPLLNEDNADRAKAYAAMFKVAALSRVIILDERIQLVADSNQLSDFGVAKIDVLRLARVFVPARNDCNLDGESLSWTEIEGWLARFKEDCPLNIDYRSFDFVVIHQGIVEKLRKVHGHRQTDIRLRKLAAECGCAGRLIICSGRGVPRGIPDGARFLPLASLMQTVTVTPSKFHLVQLLCASRAPLQ